MFFIIYKTTCLINGKIYIGKHQTKDVNDGYIGSGKLLRHAIAKYGIEKFKKEILFIFDNEDEMNRKEEELVSEELIDSEKSYNLCQGGKGGFGYINSNGLNVYENQRDQARINILKAIPFARKAIEQNKEKWKANISASLKGKPGGFTGKNHSEQSKEKMKASSPRLSGDRNSQYGTMWINNGSINKKIKNTEVIPAGWNKGKYKKIFIFQEQCRIEKTKYRELQKTKQSKLYSKYHDIYDNLGWNKFVEITSYPYSKPCFVQMLKKYVPEFKPQNGKKRGQVSP